MTDKSPAATDSQPCEVPLIEQLRSIPRDFRASRPIQWAADGTETGHQFIPVGYMMHRAANQIAKLQARLSEREPVDRNAVLEEAALECEKYQDNVADRLADYSNHWQHGAAAGAEDCSEAIRALKKAAPGCGGPDSEPTLPKSSPAAEHSPESAAVARCVAVPSDVFDEIVDLLENYSDVVDGNEGQPRPNKAMSLLGTLRDGER